MIRPYLQLVRIPGIFTAFTNVLLGFFVVQANTSWETLVPLLLASGFLYLGGMTLNDYFDFKTDLKNRSFRPIPSGKISKESALLIGISFLTVANAFSVFGGTQSLIISLAMTIVILSYNVKVKTIPIVGIFCLSSIRFLNVLLGASIVQLDFKVAILAVPVAIFVGAISVLAKTEDSAECKKAVSYNIILISITLVFITLISANTAKYEYFIFIFLFAVATLLPYVAYKNKTQFRIQKIVTYQLLAIIILDATLLAAFSTISYALVAILLYIPAYFLMRISYLT